MDPLVLTGVISEVAETASGKLELQDVYRHVGLSIYELILDKATWVLCG
jgi:hypothetical protein